MTHPILKPPEPTTYTVLPNRTETLHACDMREGGEFDQKTARAETARWSGVVALRVHLQEPVQGHAAVGVLGHQRDMRLHYGRPV